MQFISTSQERWISCPLLVNTTPPTFLEGFGSNFHRMLTYCPDFAAIYSCGMEKGGLYVIFHFSPICLNIITKTDLDKISQIMLPCAYC